MAREFKTISMPDLSPGEAYDLLSATIAPRPIAFVTTVNGLGEPNLAPFSFFVMGGANPPSLIFSAILSVDGNNKETYNNVVETGEFVVNTVHREMMVGVASAAVKTMETASKWDRTGFTALESIQVKPPRLAESLVQFECKVFKTIEHGEGPGAARYVIGEVLVAHVLETLFLEGQVAGDLMVPIARMGGKVYVDTATWELFE